MSNQSLESIVWRTEDLILVLRPTFLPHSKTFAKLLLSLGLKDGLCLAFVYIKVLNTFNHKGPGLKQPPTTL